MSTDGEEMPCYVSDEATGGTTRNESETSSGGCSAPSSPTNLEQGDSDVFITVVETNSDDMELLAKLEEANRLLEADSKSLRSVPATSTTYSSDHSAHSRRSSGSSVLSSLSSNVPDGSEGGGSGDGSATAVQSQVSQLEEDLWSLWGHIVNDWDNFSRKKMPYVKELVRKGIPHHFRGIAWQLLCGSHESRSRDDYVNLIKSQSPCEKVIRRDIARTYPEHDFFKEKDGLGQESLFNVLKAYSLRDREVGYCQGTAFMVGLLLMQMPEEEAFSVLVKIMQEERYRMREMFKPSMSELGLCMYQLECMVQDLLPDLHLHFHSQGFYTSMYASSWFLTLYTTSLPLDLACRIMDVFISEGLETIFRVAIAILQLNKTELMELDMEGMLRYFQKDVPLKHGDDPDTLLTLAYHVKFNAKKMKKLEKEYFAIKTKEQEEQIEIKRLRTENRLLRQRVDRLEAESADLADRLIEGQVQRAEEAEEIYTVRRELHALKHRDGDLAKQLEQLKGRLAAETKVGVCNGESADVTTKEDGGSGLSSRAAEQRLNEAEELVGTLQEELVAVKLREAEGSCVIRGLKERIRELEESNKKMRDKEPDAWVAGLQEELLAVKMREAEANLALKELREKVHDLDGDFQLHISKINEFSALNEKKNDNNNNKNTIQKLHEELMTVKLRDAETLAESKELKQKVMEMETQCQVSHNQLKRADAENENLKIRCEEAEEKVKTLEIQMKEERHKYTDLQSTLQTEQMLSRVREAEKSQTVAELTQRIAELEIKNQELVTDGQIHATDGRDLIKELQDRINDIHVENNQLRVECGKPTVEAPPICNGTLLIHSSPRRIAKESSRSRLSLDSTDDEVDIQDVVSKSTMQTDPDTLRAPSIDRLNNLIGC